MCQPWLKFSVRADATLVIGVLDFCQMANHCRGCMSWHAQVAALGWFAFAVVLNSMTKGLFGFNCTILNIPQTLDRGTSTDICRTYVGISESWLEKLVFNFIVQNICLTWKGWIPHWLGNKIRWESQDKACTCGSSEALYGGALPTRPWLWMFNLNLDYWNILTIIGILPSLSSYSSDEKWSQFTLVCKIR